MTPRKKLTFEFHFNCSSKLLYPYLNTPGGLTEWLCDNVDVNNGTHYIFHWDSEVRQAKQSEVKLATTVRYTWEEPKGEFMEFLISPNEMTNDITLVITDFAEENEAAEYQMLWENSVQDLKHLVGA